MRAPPWALFQVHAKAPRAGSAKTRLGEHVGHTVAADLARAFLQDTFRGLRRLGARAVLVTPEPAEDHGVDAEVWDQGGGDLGERLERSFRRGLQDHAAVIALGGDSPGLPTGHVRALLSLLEAHDAALGPAEDGGFWTLGLRRCPAGCLAGVPWSRPDTAAKAAARFPGIVFAPRWWDVDGPDDLRRLRDRVPLTDAPATHAALP